MSGRWAEVRPVKTYHDHEFLHVDVSGRWAEVRPVKTIAISKCQNWVMSGRWAEVRPVPFSAVKTKPEGCGSSSQVCGMALYSNPYSPPEF